MNKTMKRWLSILVILSILVVIGLTIYFAVTGSPFFWGMLALMFFYPIFLWMILFLYKKSDKDES